MKFLHHLISAKVVTILRIFVSSMFLITIALVISRNPIHLSFYNKGLHWWFIAILPVCGMLGAKTIKWHLIISGLEPRITMFDAFRSYVGAIPISLITPGRIGEFSRILFIPYQSLQSVVGAGAVFLDKLSDLVTLAWWVVLGLFFTSLSKEFVFIIGGLVLIFSPIPFWLKQLEKLLRVLPIGATWYNRIHGAVLNINSISSARFLGVFIFGMLSFAMEWIQYWAFFNVLTTIDVQVDLKLTVSVMSLVTFANVFQISFAGIGVREGLTAFLLRNRLSPGISAVSAFAVFFIDQAIPGIIGLGFRPELHGLKRGNIYGKYIKES